MVYKWDLHIPKLSPELSRRAYLYLPAGYDEQPDRRFPVMYMFDGHNVFLTRTRPTANHGAWRAIWMKRRRRSSSQRWSAIPSATTVWKNIAPLPAKTQSWASSAGAGRATMNWFVHEFKPMIDANIRTLSDRSNTFICGSSMGGLMSLYAATAFNATFGKAACLSPSLWLGAGKMRRIINQADIAPDTLIYMDYGGEEMANHAANLSALTSCSTALLKKGVDLTFRIAPGGTPLRSLMGTADSGLYEVSGLLRGRHAWYSAPNPAKNPRFPDFPFEPEDIGLYCRPSLNGKKAFTRCEAAHAHFLLY